jgi:hypothetical protein
VYDLGIARFRRRDDQSVPKRDSVPRLGFYCSADMGRGYCDPPELQQLVSDLSQRGAWHPSFREPAA